MDIDRYGFIVGRRKYVPHLALRRGWSEYAIVVFDIFFLCLMFYALSLGTSKVSGIDVEVPRVETSGSISAVKCVVSIVASPDGSDKIYYTCNGRDINWDQTKTMDDFFKECANMKAMGRTTGDNRPIVLIRADRNAKYETVAEVMAGAAKLNVSSFLVLEQK